jgi:hypothetical protein
MGYNYGQNSRQNRVELNKILTLLNSENPKKRPKTRVPPRGRPSQNGPKNNDAPSRSQAS